MTATPDPAFSDPRLAATYDVFEGERDDLDHYERLVDEFGARSVLDVGCGTGELACRLARRGVAVTGVDPAEASLDIARSKPDADSVRWILGTAVDVPSLDADLATMTGNVAQVFLTDESWRTTLDAIARALRPGGTLVFETRDPARRAWDRWTPDLLRATAVLPDGDRASTWCTLTSVELPLVSFRFTTVFESDGAEVVSDSTLRFRSRTEIEHSLDAAGFELLDIRDAPDRPGMEWVFVAQRRERSGRPPSERSGRRVGGGSPAVGGDAERGTDLAHPRAAQRSEALDEHPERDRLDGVEIDCAPPPGRVVAGLEHDLARHAANRGGARRHQRPAQPQDRCVAGEHDDRPSTDRGRFTTTARLAWGRPSCRGRSASERVEVAPFVSLLDGVLGVGDCVGLVDLCGSVPRQ